MVGTGSVPLEPGPPRLNTPLDPGPDGLPAWRIVDLDFNRSIDEIIADFPGTEKISNTKNHAERWMKLMKYRQNLVEEKVDKVFKGVNTLTTTVKGAELMYKTLQEDIEVLQSNNSGVWEKLKIDEQR